MAAISHKLINQLIDAEFRGIAYSMPSSIYLALFRATAGQSPRNTAATSGQTTIPATPNGRMYRCSTAGTTGSGEPTWPTTTGGTVTDGTAVWTEMTTDFEANSAALQAVEVSGNGYARQPLAPSATNWAATNATGSTASPSTGTTGTTSNNAAVTFGPSTGAWGVIGGAATYDALTVGNLRVGGGANQVQSVIGAGGSIVIAAGQFAFNFVL